MLNFIVLTKGRGQFTYEFVPGAWGKFLDASVKSPTIQCYCMMHDEWVSEEVIESKIACMNY